MGSWLPSSSVKSSPAASSAAMPVASSGKRNMVGVGGVRISSVMRGRGRSVADYWVMVWGVESGNLVVQ